MQYSTADMPSPTNDTITTPQTVPVSTAVLTNDLAGTSVNAYTAGLHGPHLNRSAGQRFG